MKKIITMGIALMLAGCSSSPVAPDRLSEITVYQDVVLKTNHAWPLKNCGTFLQKVDATVQDQTQTFSVHLTASPQALEAVAFNDIAGRLYTLKWTPETIEWEGSAYIPPEMMPENIIADYLMAQLTDKDLITDLDGAVVQDKTTGSQKTRTIQNNKTRLRTFTYEKPQGDLWTHLIIENHVIGYKLDIQMVAQ